MHRKVLHKLIRRGTLTLIEPDGTALAFGSGEPQVTWRIHTRHALQRLVRDPEFELGETYMAGDWEVVDGSLRDLIHLLRINVSFDLSPRWQKRTRALWQQWNGVRRSRRNVSQHYDLDEALFRTFLDENMHYSCAYFPAPGYSLEAAQRAKSELIATKLLLEPGHRVLDIGCGWGSLALHLAEQHGVSVTGLTLSNEQARVARQEARRRGLDDRVEFLLEDYREHSHVYDRVVSVGMFEHVGKRHYGTFFDVVRDRLHDDGVGLLHTIGASRPPMEATNPWINRYIFPGGYIPALSEVVPHIEASRLLLCDLEVLRQHYAETLRAWSERFGARRASFVASRGERFCRMWEFYLAVCEIAFRAGDLVNFQFQLAGRQATVPLTRDYLIGAASAAVADDIPNRHAQVRA